MSNLAKKQKVKRNILIIIIVLIALVLAGATFYYFKFKPGIVQRKQLTVKAGLPGDFKFLKFSNAGPGKETASNIFSAGERVGLAATNPGQLTTLTVRISNIVNKSTVTGNLNRQNQQSNYFCCVTTPNNPGRYILQVIENNQTSGSFPLEFTVR